jgi:hypothetical protein
LSQVLGSTGVLHWMRFNRKIRYPRWSWNADSVHPCYSIVSSVPLFVFRPYLNILLFSWDVSSENWNAPTCTVIWFASSFNTRTCSFCFVFIYCEVKLALFCCHFACFNMTNEPNFLLFFTSFRFNYSLCFHGKRDRTYFTSLLFALFHFKFLISFSVQFFVSISKTNFAGPIIVYCMPTSNM